jgi:uncharacterized protein (TIGR00369 family)
MASAQTPVILRQKPTGTIFASQALELSGLEVLRAMLERRLPDPPITRLTGLRMTDVGLGLATMAMPASPWWQSGVGLFLAGTLAFLADGPLGGAVMTGAGPGIGMTTSELALDFLRPATIRSGTLIGRGHLIHSSRSQGLSEVFLEDGRGRMLGHGTSRGILFPMDRRSLPEPPKDLEEGDGPEPYKLEVEGDVFGADYWNTKTGMEINKDAVAGYFMPPICQFVGMRSTEFDEGRAVATIPASAWFTNGYGVMYGGALALLADYALNCAILTTIPAATSFSPLDLKLNFLRPVFPDGGLLTARATVTHRGRSIAVASCEILNQAGKQVALAGETILILPGRSWDRPVYVADEVLAGAREPV